MYSQPACIIYWGTFAPEMPSLLKGVHVVVCDCRRLDEFVRRLGLTLIRFRHPSLSLSSLIFFSGMSARSGFCFGADHDRGEGKMCRSDRAERGSFPPKKETLSNWLYFGGDFEDFLSPRWI